MKAWKIVGEKTAELVDLGAQPVAPACVKLKMLAALIDVAESSLYSGGSETPLVLGRNGVGLVSEIGSEVVGVKRGDICYIRPVSSCGECGNCKAGREYSCEHGYEYGKTEDGIMRDFVVVPLSDVVALPGKVAPEEGVFIETVSLAIEALDHLKVEKGEHVVIMGANNVGLILAQAALYYQAVPILVDMRADRLELAEKLGVYYTINAVETDPVKKVFSITCGKMAETLAYCLGSGLAVQRAFECLECGGRSAFVGLKEYNADLTFDYMPLLSRNVSIIPVSGAQNNYLSAVNMIASKAVDVCSLISRKVDFASVGTALKEFSEDGFKYSPVLVELDKI